MTTFRSDQTPPPWCELREFDCLEIADGKVVEQQRRQPAERLLVTAGTVQVMLPGRSVVLKQNQFLDIDGAGRWSLVGRSSPARVARLSGRWGADLGGCGVFTADNAERPVNAGDPVTYRKTTSIDVHFHDCDEYWIVLEGRGTTWVGGRFFPVGPGDCLAIGMGHHHDFPTVEQGPVRAVFFETTLEGRQRVGHLWEHTHGRAEPRADRI